MSKRKKVSLFIISAIVLIVLFVAVCCRTFTENLINAEVKGFHNEKSQILKEGYYCGEGGENCGHGNGYIYYHGSGSTDEAMKSLGFEKEDSGEYLYGADHLKIVMKIPVPNGWFIYYRITGTC